MSFSQMILENFAAGRQAFSMISRHNMEWVNSPENSAVVEAYLWARGIPESETHYAKPPKMIYIPSFEPGQTGTLGWTWLYCLTTPCREEHLLDAWQLIQFLGAKDAEGATTQRGTSFACAVWALPSRPCSTTPKLLT